MKINDLLKSDKLTISFEVFPPKTESNFDTVAVVSHGGSSSAVLSHMFNLPFTFTPSAMPPNFIAITSVTLNGGCGQLISPKFELLNDALHITGMEADYTCRN